jgi:hypothetical protein
MQVRYTLVSDDHFWHLGNYLRFQENSKKLRIESVSLQFVKAKKLSRVHKQQDTKIQRVTHKNKTKKTN